MQKGFSHSWAETPMRPCGLEHDNAEANLSGPMVLGQVAAF